MLSYINGQIHHQCHLMTLGGQVHLGIFWHKCIQQCYEVYAYVLQWSTM